MSKINDGGPAFPRPVSHIAGVGIELPQQGMTLRDYFAGQALAGIWAAQDSADMDYTYEQMAIHAAASADALLAKLAQDPSP